MFDESSAVRDGFVCSIVPSSTDTGAAHTIHIYGSNDFDYAAQE